MDRQLKLTKKLAKQLAQQEETFRSKVKVAKYWLCDKGHTEEFVFGEQLFERSGLKYRPCVQCRAPMHIESRKLTSDKPAAAGWWSKVKAKVEPEEQDSIEVPQRRIVKPRTLITQLLKSLGKEKYEISGKFTTTSSKCVGRISQRGTIECNLTAKKILIRPFIEVEALEGSRDIRLTLVNKAGYVNEIKRACKRSKITILSINFAEIVEEASTKGGRNDRRKATH